MGSLQEQAGKETVNRYDIPKISASEIIKRAVTDLWALKNLLKRKREVRKKVLFVSCG